MHVCGLIDVWINKNNILIDLVVYNYYLKTRYVYAVYMLPSLYIIGLVSISYAHAVFNDVRCF